MPAIELKCQADWFPPVSLGPKEHSTVGGRPLTTICMAERVVEVTPHIINSVDERTVDDHMSPEAVWADFHLMWRPINATEVLIIARVPEVDGNFQERKARREKLALEYREEVKALLLADCDHLLLPLWEIEVIPEGSSGFGQDRMLEESYRW